MKLSKEEICSYLPYNVKVLRSNGNFQIIEDLDFNEIFENTIDKFQLILRPIETFDNFVNFLKLSENDLTFNEYKIEIFEGEALIHSNVPCISLETFENFRKNLLRNHFDIFSLIEKGLAIPLTENY